MPRQLVIQQVDEITIEVDQGLIVLEQKNSIGNEPHRIAFPYSYANQVLNAIMKAANL